MGYETLTQR